MPKHYLDKDVLTAAQERIERAFDDFPRVYVSFSAGKDSTVMLHLVAAEARKRGRRIGLLLIDLEGQYDLTIRHALRCYEEYADVVEPYWVCLPIDLRNAVSVYQPKWRCWDPEKEDIWIRRPPDIAITDPAYFPFFREGMEFEEFVPEFGEWYSQGEPTACFVGIRSDESLNRYRTISSTTKATHAGLQWTSQVTDHCYNAYPIYDWRTEDIWTWHGRNPAPYGHIRPGHMERRIERQKGSRAILDLGKGAAMGQLRILQNLFHRLVGGCGYPHFGEFLQTFLGGEVARPILDDLHELGPVGAPFKVFLEPGIGQDFRAVHAVGDGVKRFFAADRQHHISVLGFHRAEQRAAWPFDVELRLLHLVRKQAQHAFQHGDVDQLPFSGGPPHVERDANGPKGIGSGNHIRDVDAAIIRLFTVALIAQMRQVIARGRMYHRRIGRECRHGSALAKA